MKPSVKVLVGKTWSLVQRHDIYSCPDTAEFNYSRNAVLILLKSRKRNESENRFVYCIVTLSPNTPDLNRVPVGLRSRLKAYISEATRIDGILNGDRHRFYFLWPNFIQEYATLGQRDTDATLALWVERDRWFRWPKEATVLQEGWTRHRDGNKRDCYAYGPELKKKLAQNNLKPDGRNNGPAILAFRMTGGERPPFNGEGWPIHHIYDGRARIPTKQARILHAVRDGEHFTHSGGLVAAHPAAHFVAHHSELLSWLLRWEAFCRFGYDPNGVFKKVA